MRTVVQRVTRASVRVDGEIVGAIEQGALLLVGVERGDDLLDADATAHKIARLRFFPGATPMDRTLTEVGGGVLVVSQFTLAATLARGNRPSFARAEEPSLAESLYLRVADQLRALGIAVATGRFRAAMAVELVNDGPVTFLVIARGGKIHDVD
jgi:D-tyrosyl-tRNA(Tyr) deacylase